ncbi:SpoIIE family protein phosphatase [Cellulomonas sp. 179-A 4D5 NHS]|uniref:SpoIIE family protein phosphatase n=1 Tax=Cellulomonas sp. 179-A 4D5 NHS TaxID=3142378 RepID=UPI0039A15A41
MTGSPADAWRSSPSGLLVLDADGTVVAANDTFLRWVGRAREDVVGRERLSGLLSVGGRIYWETHLAPMLHVDGRADEVALELRTPTGRMPVLLTAMVRGTDADGRVQVHVALSSARERSRYERELLAARREADRSAAQVRVLQRATSALSRATGVRGVAHAVLDAAVGDLGARAATVWLADASGALRLHGSLGERVDEVGGPPADAVLGQRRAAVDGDRVVVPLHGQAGPQGVLVLLPRDDPGVEPPALEVVTALGEQAGLALHRAELYEHSATVAHELQHSLLATDPPVDPRFEVTSAYRPGVEALDVGGDWHDAFLAEDGVLSVVVGDVVGRGLGAASAMGQVRSAIRAVAGPGVGPARLVQRLDRFVDQVHAAAMATMAYVEVELATGHARYVCAGHLPPLLVRASGGAELLWGGRSTPLGVRIPGRERREGTFELAPGDRLLLYTDGLVERRHRLLEESLEGLAVAAASLRDEPAGVAVPALVQRLLRDERGRDDVCVLLLGWRGGPAGD